MSQVTPIASGRRRYRSPLSRVLALLAVGAAALHCNTFDDPPKRDGSHATALPRSTEEQTWGQTTAPPVVTRLPPVEPLPHPPPVVLPGATDGGVASAGTTGAPVSSEAPAASDATSHLADAAVEESTQNDPTDASVDAATGNPAAQDASALSDAGA